MEIVSGLIFEVVSDLVLNFPGAFIRWIFLHRKRTYKSLLSDTEINAMVAIIVIAAVIFIVTLYKLFI